MSPDELRHRGIIEAGIVVGLLAMEAYEALERATQGRHLSKAELRDAVASVGRPLVQPPRDVWAAVEAGPVPNTEPVSYDVVVPLWTESGPAGVGVEIRLVPTPWQTFRTEILGVRAVDVGPGPWGPPWRRNGRRGAMSRPPRLYQRVIGCPNGGGACSPRSCTGW